jgi:hypothetical protein
MACRIVERFEVVKVKQKQGQGLIRPMRPSNCALKRLIERALRRRVLEADR